MTHCSSSPFLTRFLPSSFYFHAIYIYFCCCCWCIKCTSISKCACIDYTYSITMWINIGKKVENDTIFKIFPPRLVVQRVSNYLLYSAIPPDWKVDDVTSRSGWTLFGRANTRSTPTTGMGNTASSAKRPWRRKWLRKWRKGLRENVESTDRVGGGNKTFMTHQPT